MNKLFDALEACLAELEQGRSLDEALRKFPDLTDELKPLLESASRVRGLKTSGPARDVIERGRKKLLQQTAQLRARQPSLQRDRKTILYRLAASIALAILFFIGGTGIVRAASNALPGENLYPVKRNWESVRLLLSFDPVQRLALEGEFEEERHKEVGELLEHGYSQQVNFAGIFHKSMGVSYVSDIHILITSTTHLPDTELLDGMAVIVTGKTDNGGFVEAIRIELLPKGSIAPLGNPDDLEIDPDGSGTPHVPSSQQGNELENEDIKVPGKDSNGNIEFHLEGIIDSIQGEVWVVNDKTVYVQNAQITGLIFPGVEVEIYGFFAADGKFMATDVDVNDGGEDKQGTDFDSNEESPTQDYSADDDMGDGSGDGGDESSGGEDSKP